MATFTRQKLSGSTDGKPIKVAATGSPGTAIHTALSGTAGWDEIYMWVSNPTANARLLTIGWGSETDPDGLICKDVSIPANSPPIPIVPGIVLQNAAAVTAWADAANALLITGNVNRIQ